jgi:hypothetical protein
MKVSQSAVLTQHRQIQGFAHIVGILCKTVRISDDKHDAEPVEKLARFHFYPALASSVHLVSGHGIFDD